MKSSGGVDCAAHLPDLLRLDRQPGKVLAERLPERHALKALATSQQLGLRRHASRHLWPRAWELRTNLSADDALHVALAEQLGITLLTADGRAARAPHMSKGAPPICSCR